MMVGVVTFSQIVCIKIVDETLRDKVIASLYKLPNGAQFLLRPSRTKVKFMYS